MKQILKFIVLFVCCIEGYAQTTPSQDKNYIHTIVYKEPFQEISLNSVTADKRVETIVYFDDLGRTSQTVGIRAGGQEQDVISFNKYDTYGRENKVYLPYARAINNGSFDNNSLNATQNFYNTFKYENTTNPYSEVVFEDSPLGRVLEQGAPGSDWQVNSNSDTDRTVKLKYQVYTTFDAVKQFDVTHPNNNFEETELNLIGNYANGELTKSVIIDENWQPNQTYDKDHTTVEYTNRLGQLILKRNYNKNLIHDTYYVYDDFGNLTYVIPPLANEQNVTSEANISSNIIVNSSNTLNLNATNSITLTPGFHAQMGSSFSALITATNSNDVINNLCYVYRYDKRNRIIETKTPGKGWEYIVYDILDRPILSQDAKMRITNTWLFTKYNKLGKVLYTGEYTYTPSGNNENSGRLEMQNIVNSQANPKWHETTGTTTVDGMAIEYTNQSYPTSNLTLYTIHYYDDYNLNTAGIGLSLPTTILGQQVSSKIKSLATASKVRVLGTNQWETIVTYYDKKGRPIYVANNNAYLSTIDITKIRYDFIGQILESENSHTKSGTSIVTNNTFAYDHAGRILTQQQTINGGTPELIVNNIYDELGRLESKKVGGTVAATPINSNGLQTIDYAFNIRGWLKEINNPDNLGNDLFGFKIGYNQGSNALYNGNISQTNWKTASVNPTSNPVSNTYNYTYDALNRIISATDNTGNYNLSGINYDKNGNIQILERKAVGGLMDKLSYNYDAGNKLKSVADAIISTLGNEGFKDGNTSGDDYTYDVNGNMISDANKGITSIIYNHLNLPTLVSINDGGSNNGTISYIYDAIGTKLEKLVSTVNGEQITTQYSNGYVYENVYLLYAMNQNHNFNLKFFKQPEGYVEPITQTVSGKGGSTTTIIGFNYIYQYKDNLGNTRLSYKDNNGTLEIIEENNYYPFGLKHNGYNNGISANTNTVASKFKFNGKEQEKALGYNLYEMDVRSLDPALGRWTTIDPVTHHNISTYNAFDNNPVLFADPSGADGMIGTHGGSGWTLFNGMMGTQQIGGDYSGLAEQFNNVSQQPNSSLEGRVDPDNVIYNISKEEWAKLAVGYEELQEVTIILNKKESYDAAILNIVGQIYATDWYVTSSKDEFNWGIPIGLAGTAASAGGEYADNMVRMAFKTGRNPVSWGKLTPKQQAWRTVNVLGKNAKYVKYVKGAGVIGTGISVGMAGYDIASGQGTTIDYLDVGVGTASIGAAIFLASNPVGWVIGTGATVYFAGRLIYDIFEEVND